MRKFKQLRDGYSNIDVQTQEQPAAHIPLNNFENASGKLPIADLSANERYGYAFSGLHQRIDKRSKVNVAHQIRKSREIRAFNERLRGHLKFVIKRRFPFLRVPDEN